MPLTITLCVCVGGAVYKGRFSHYLSHIPFGIYCFLEGMVTVGMGQTIRTLLSTGGYHVDLLILPHRAILGIFTRGS